MVAATGRTMQATVLPTTLAQPDLDLVDRYRSGDADAFAEIYRRYGGMTFNLAYRLSGDQEVAADLTQEIFLRVFRHLGSFRGGSSLKTWLYRVAVNHCRSRLGRRQPEPTLGEEGQEMAARIPDTHANPEEDALALDRRRRVGRALAEVPVVFREALVLCDLEGLAYQEIAAVLGVRVGTVRSRIARGREHLKRRLDGAP